MAVLDFNPGSELPQATTKKGEQRYNMGFSKVTKRWSTKPIKQKKDKSVFFEMIQRTVDIIQSKITLLPPALPSNLPKNIAPVPRPNKQETIENQKSRFI